ncbi:MAG: MmcB family DNA repair protein, partial [Magnetospiraceae bacterium]
ADHKWPAYTDWCDRFYFCVDPDFPQDLLPADQGLIISDGFDADIIRPAREHPLHASRRKALILRFARKAAQRLHWVEDPNRYGA